MDSFVPTLITIYLAAFLPRQPSIDRCNRGGFSATCSVDFLFPPSCRESLRCRGLPRECGISRVPSQGARAPPASLGCCMIWPFERPRELPLSSRTQRCEHKKPAPIIFSRSASIMVPRGTAVIFSFATTLRSDVSAHYFAALFCFSDSPRGHGFLLKNHTDKLQLSISLSKSSRVKYSISILPFEAVPLSLTFV